MPNIDYIQNLEKAVKEKYGNEATMNPKHFWDENKEKEYIEETKKAIKKEYLSQDSREQIEVEGILVTKRTLINSNNINKICKSCKIYSFNRRDDLYMNKFNLCYKCYLCNEDK